MHALCKRRWWFLVPKKMLHFRTQWLDWPWWIFYIHESYHLTVLYWGFRWGNIRTQNLINLCRQVTEQREIKILDFMTRLLNVNVHHCSWLWLLGVLNDFAVSWPESDSTVSYTLPTVSNKIKTWKSLQKLFLKVYSRKGLTPYSVRFTEGFDSTVSKHIPRNRILSVLSCTPRGVRRCAVLHPSESDSVPPIDETLFLVQNLHCFAVKCNYFSRVLLAPGLARTL